jgi:hypothetical protein
MKVLIYKRTHKGDPDKNGIFGSRDCMGRIRNWSFDAVIGIGGSLPWKSDLGIKHKVNWIGLHPKKIAADYYRGDKIAFTHFALFDETGPDIKDLYPNLFYYMFENRKRFDMSSKLPEKVFEEVTQILDLVKNYPASKAIDLNDDSCFENRNEKISTCRGCLGYSEMDLSICES